MLLHALIAGCGMNVFQSSADFDVGSIVGNDEPSTTLPFCALIYCSHIENYKLSQCNPASSAFDSF